MECVQKVLAQNVFNQAQAAHRAGAHPVDIRPEQRTECANPDAETVQRTECTQPDAEGVQSTACASPDAERVQHMRSACHNLLGHSAADVSGTAHACDVSRTYQQSPGGY